jgi:transcriptional regulator with XRE-family HTH domain
MYTVIVKYVMDPVDIFREKLRKITLGKNPSQAEIAKSIGITARELNAFIHSNRRKTPKNLGTGKLLDICEFLGVRYDEMVRPDDVNCQLLEDAEIIDNVIESEHFAILKQFKDKSAAKNINADLLELERMDPLAFQETAAYIRGMVKGLKKARDIQRRPERRIAQRRGAADDTSNPDKINRRLLPDRRKNGSTG